VREYHWFTEAIEDLANCSDDDENSAAILGLSGAISTFVKEANLSQRDLQKLEEINDGLSRKFEAVNLASAQTPCARRLSLS